MLLNIGINYCGFQYKHRFQKAGYRAKIASKLISEDEAVTENGYIRRIFVPEKGGYQPISEAEFLKNYHQFSEVKIEYLGTILNDSGKTVDEGRVVSIGGINYPVEEGNPCQPVILANEQIKQLVEIISHSDQLPEDPELFTVWKHERIEPGIRNYF